MTGRPTHRRRPTGRRQAGTASVEFVLILPLLMALFALAVDGGRMLGDYHTVSKSVRDAARFLARAEPGIAAGRCMAGNLDRGRANVSSAIRLAMTGRVDGDPASDGLVIGWHAANLSEAATGIGVTLECLDNASGTLDGLFAGAAAVPSIVVRARVPFRFGPARALGLGPAFTLQVAHKTARLGV